MSEFEKILTYFFVNYEKDYQKCVNLDLKWISCIINTVCLYDFMIIVFMLVKACKQYQTFIKKMEVACG